MKKTLVLMRHGETLFNVQHKTQGWCDSPLTERGIEQAKVAGRALKAEGLAFDHAFSSTAERCCDTLEIATAEAFGVSLPYERKKDLRELGFGAFEGKDDYLEPRPHGDFYLQFGGENQQMGTTRIVRCLTQIMNRPDCTNVLVATSGGISACFYAANAARARAQLEYWGNCFVFVYGFEEGLFTCETIVYPGLDGEGDPQHVMNWTSTKQMGMDFSQPGFTM